MKKRYLLLLISSIIFFVNVNVVAKIVNKIVVKVENKIITNYEIKNKILTTLILANEEINQENINSLKNQALDSLINLKLKEIEVSKYKIKRNENQIQKYLNSISLNNIQDLKGKFVSNKLDYELFLNEIETQIKWQEYIYNIYSKKIELDENSINDEVAKIIENNSLIEEFNISEIEIQSSNLKSDNERVSEIKRSIENVGFENTALKYSISSTSSEKGSLGWINGKSLSRNIYSSIKNLEPGEISNPIKRQNSILFLKLNDLKTSKANNLIKDDLKEKIINQKKTELFNLYSNSHLSKLKNTSLIEY